MRQPLLACTLGRIAAKGKRVFYAGPVATSWWPLMRGKAG